MAEEPIKKIKSIGMLNRLSFVEDYAKKHGIEHINIYNLNSLNDITQVLLEESVDYIYIDLVALDDTVDNILNFFEQLKNDNKTETRIIIGATSHLPESDLVVGIRQLGIEFFVFGEILYEQSEDFIKCMDGNNEKSKIIPTPITNNNNNKEKSPNLPLRNYKTIGVFSSIPRIGTSTVAIQIVKYLQHLGYNACYLEMNNSNLCLTLLNHYSDCLNFESKGKVRYQNIDMYYDMNNLSTILDLEYDFYVYDYGTTEEISFLEKDIKIVVLGTFISEINSSQNMIGQYYDKNVHYFYNLTSETDFNDLLEKMDDKVDNSFLLSYCPDPFFLSSKNIKTYDRVFSFLKNKSSDIVSPKKPNKKFFTWRKSHE